MRRLVVLLFVAMPAVLLLGCGEPDYSDIPDLDPAEQAAVDAEAEAGMEAALKEQAGKKKK